jgi:glycosyltransferase involved in cell wall biosynthesis
LKPSLSLILPIYNSASFLEGSLAACRDWLVSMDRETELVLVDDASEDESPAILRAFVERMSGEPGPRIVLLQNEPNMGKGHAVRRGMLEATGDLRIFTDADLTYPIQNADRLIGELEGDSDVAIGSRMHSESRYIVAPEFLHYVYTRHTMGRIFNLLVRMLVVPGILDTQAGLKGFTSKAAELVFSRGDRNRFSFDVELLYIAQRHRLAIVQCPVRFIYKKEPSTVHFFKDSIVMIWSMFRVRIRGMRGKYD